MVIQTPRPSACAVCDRPVGLLDDAPSWPDGEHACEPGVSGSCPKGYVCKPRQCPYDYRCYRKVAGERNHYPGDCIIDGVCDVEACESCRNCPEDCSGFCAAATASETPREDYIISESTIPATSMPPTEIGTDLDGDLTIDNRLGGLVYMLDFESEESCRLDANGDMNDRLHQLLEISCSCCVCSRS